MFGKVSETGLPTEVVVAGGGRGQATWTESGGVAVPQGKSGCSDRKKPRMMGRKENTGAHCRPSSVLL